MVKCPKPPIVSTGLPGCFLSLVYRLMGLRPPNLLKVFWALRRRAGPNLKIRSRSQALKSWLLKTAFIICFIHRCISSDATAGPSWSVSLPQLAVNAFCAAVMMDLFWQKNALQVLRVMSYVVGTNKTVLQCEVIEASYRVCLHVSTRCLCAYSPERQELLTCYFCGMLYPDSGEQDISRNVFQPILDASC
jgi:hypothetical protein